MEILHNKYPNRKFSTDLVNDKGIVAVMLHTLEYVRDNPEEFEGLYREYYVVPGNASIMYQDGVWDLIVHSLDNISVIRGALALLIDFDGNLGYHYDTSH